MNIFFVLFCLIGTLSACLLYEMEDKRNRSAPQPENRTESALKFPTTIDFSFDSVKMLSFPGISTTFSNDFDGARRIYFRPDGEIFFLALTYYPGNENPNFYMFGARGAPVLKEERNEILQSEQSLSRWMAEQLLTLKKDRERTRRNLIDEL